MEKVLRVRRICRNGKSVYRLSLLDALTRFERAEVCNLFGRRVSGSACKALGSAGKNPECMFLPCLSVPKAGNM